MLNKPFFRYVLSPLATALGLALIHLAPSYDLATPSLFLPVGVLAICMFWSGLWANVLGAIFISAYAFWRSDYDLSLTLQVMFVAGAVAIGDGILRRWLIKSIRGEEWQRLRAAENQSKADFVDSLNGNIQTIKEINQELIELTNGMPVLERHQIRQKLEITQLKAANLAQRVIGWHQLAQEKKELLKDE